MEGRQVGKKVILILTDDCKVDERVPGRRLREVHPAAVLARVRAGHVVDAEQG